MERPKVSTAFEILREVIYNTLGTDISGTVNIGYQ